LVIIMANRILRPSFPLAQHAPASYESITAGENGDEKKVAIRAGPDDSPRPLSCHIRCGWRQKEGITE
jgi:hypothetical protein